MCEDCTNRYKAYNVVYCHYYGCYVLASGIFLNKERQVLTMLPCNHRLSIIYDVINTRLQGTIFWSRLLNISWVFCCFMSSNRLSNKIVIITWYRLLLSCNPGHFSFILCAASDTLPTAVNLQSWNVQYDAKCTLCGSFQPTTAHVLGGCPVALTQGRFMYRHG